MENGSIMVMSNVSEILENYGGVEPIIKKIYSSGLRTRIYTSLSKEPKRLCDICNAVGCNPQNASTRIKELQDMALVEQKEGGYTLTVWGEIVKHKTLELNIQSIGEALNKDYSKIESIIKKIYSSGLRTRTFVSLSKEPKRICDICDIVGCNPQNASTRIKELQDMALVEHKKGGYALTVWGEIVKHKILETIKILSTFKKHDEWWLNHIIEIPDEFLYELDALSNSKIIGSNIDILSAHNKHMSLIKEADELKLITPIFYNSFVNALFERIEKNLETELIVTPEVVKYISNIMLKKNLNLINLFGSQNIKIRKMKNDLKMGLTLTEKTMMLGLYKFDNTYDFLSHFTSSNTEAVEWGGKLYEYFKKNSELVNLNEFRNK